MNAPTKELMRLVYGSTERRPLFRHGGNPLVKWCVGNLFAVTDSTGNIKFDKKKSAELIDPVVAA